MKFVRYEKDTVVRYGVVEGNTILEIEGDVFSKYKLTKKTCSLDVVKILSPCAPSKIIAIGLNYRSHADELKMGIPEEPMIFMKPPTSVIGPDETIVYPEMSNQIDYEGELGVVIGTKCRFVSEEGAEKHILGYTCFNDVTARDLQRKDTQFIRAKGFDTFAPMGPFIETDIDPGKVIIETFLNGEKRQSGTTSDLIFPVKSLISFLSKIMTLCPGDVIATGTPCGIGPMKHGDIVEVKIEGIGSLRNRVSALTV